MEDKVIDIAAQLGRDLKSRTAVRDLYDKFVNNNWTDAKIDFSNVNFVTRSFMDEFYNIFVANEEMNAELINISPEIKAMLDAVKSTQRKPEKSAKIFFRKSSDIEFRSISEANKYLETLPF
jgi:hypothetical protein